MEDVRAYLGSVKPLKSEKDSAASHIKDYEYTLYSVTGYSYSEHISGKGYVESGLEKAVANLLDRRSELAEKLNSYIERERNVSRLISEIQNDNYQIILTRKYLDGLSLSAIANEMHYTVKWIKVLHLRALQAAEEIYMTGNFT